MFLFKKRYNVCFDIDGGTFDADLNIKVKEGKKIKLKNNPSKVGHTFIGWFNEDELWDLNKDIVNRDIVLKAKWKLNKYKLTIKNYDNDIVYTFNYGEKISVLEPVRRGYTFDSYIDDIPSTMPNTDLIINTSWICDVKYNKYDYAKSIAIAGLNNKNLKEIIILEEYEGYKVKSISRSAFSNCIDLEKISIPDSVTSIGEYAFYSCTHLKSINLPKDISYILEETFWNCYSLREIIIPDSVKNIYEKAFSECWSLKSICLPSKLEKIYKDAFSYCRALESIVLPDTLTFIGKNAFAHCKNLKEIVIPESITSIEEGAFCGCTNLKNVNIKGFINEFSDKLFYDCENLIDLLSCDSITRIGNKAFYNCKKIRGPKIFNPINSVGDEAYANCENLEIVTIAKSVKNIGNFVFKNCSKLEGIIYDGTVSEWNELTKDKELSSDNFSFIVKCSNGYIKYKQEVQKINN